MNENSSAACVCRSLHFGCDVATCEQAQYADRFSNASLKQYRRCATERGCQTCLTIVNALLIPAIKSVWQDSIAQALLSGDTRMMPGIAEDEEEIQITVETPQRLTGGWFLRTGASHHSEHWRHFDIWQDLSAACEGKKCKAFLPRSCQPVQRTDSSQSLGHLKYWLKKCDETHSHCLKHNLESPTRLLKLTEGQVRLIDAEEGTKGRYMTLSHRWGANETFKLTKANILSMKQNVPWDSIPKLYQDAIKITRELQINYIWIDSLCIIQDDLGDWGRESVRMRTVYENSYLNIAGCHALGSSGGLFSSSNLMSATFGGLICHFWKDLSSRDLF